MPVVQVKTERVITIEQKKMKNWYAWLDTNSSNPAQLHAKVDMLVPNPGVHAWLVKRGYQKKSEPELLLLDPILIQRPGEWPDEPIWIQARYDEVICGLKPKEIHVIGITTISIEIT